MNNTRRIIAGLLSILLVSLSSLGYSAVTLGPYLQNATTTSMTIHWRSSEAGVGRVSYGLNKNNLNLSANETRAETQHSVTITGLQPNTQYFYRVGNGVVQEIPVNANQQYFYTNPETATPTRIWVLGDAGTGEQGQKNVRNTYYNYTGTVRTNLVLALGNNAYESGTDTQYASRFFGQYEDMFINTPVWSTQGNNERNQHVFDRAFTHPARGEGGGVTSGSELYYSFNYGDIHFICLNSQESQYMDISPNAPQYQWLERDLQANTKPWIIAFWHHPSYSITSAHNSDSEKGMKLLRENANKLLEQYGADIVLSGHNHSYNRSYLIHNHYQTSNAFLPKHKVNDGDGKTTPYRKSDNRGTVYVMTGSAGRVGYTIDSHPANAVRHFARGSFVVDVNNNTLTGKFLRETGAVDDEFTIIKNSSSNPPLTASFTFQAENRTITFTDTSQSAEGNIRGWQWDFGDNTTSTLQHPTHTYAVEGTYTVKLTVTGNENTTNTITKELQINDYNREPIANFTYQKNGTSITFTDSSNDPDGNIATRRWDFGDNTASTQANPVHNYASPGTYTVSLTIFDNEGARDIKRQEITVGAANQTPVANFNYTTNNLAAKFTDASYDTDGNITAWQWNFGDNTTSTQANPTHNYASQGTYIVSLTIFDNNRAKDVKRQVITVNDAKTPSADFSYTVNNLAATFTDTSSTPDGNITTWLWDFGDNTTSFQANPAHNYTSAGTYNVSLTVTNNNNISNTKIQTVTVHEQNQPPAANFNYTTNNLTATFNDTSYDNDGNITAWQWNFGDQTVSTQSNPMHNYASPGTYTVSLIVTDNNGGSNTRTQLITVSNNNHPPEANFNYKANKLTVFFENASRDVDGTITAWAWSFGDETTTTSTQANPSHLYTYPGTYRVSLTVTDNNGSKSTVIQSVTVSTQNQQPVSRFTYHQNNLDVNFIDQSRDNDGTLTQWLWKFGDGTTTKVHNPKHQYSQPGTYNVELTITDNMGASSTRTEQLTITANTNNHAPAAGFTTSMDRLQVKFMDKSLDVDGSIASWQWNFGDNSISTDQNPTHTYTEAGVYSVHLTVTDNQGAANTTTEMVAVTNNKKPTPSFSYTVNGMQISLTDTSKDIDGDIVSWRWQMGDGSIYTTANPKHSYTAAGDYTVTLAVTDNEGASNSISKPVAINAKQKGKKQKDSGGGGAIHWTWLLFMIFVKVGYTNIKRKYRK